MSQNDAAPRDLADFLSAHAPPHLARVIMAIAQASIEIAGIIRNGPLEGALGASLEAANEDGDIQRALDVQADDCFINALRGAGVAAVLSEERAVPLLLDPAGCVLVAIDPLDGSSNIDTNISVGTIFSVLDAPQSNVDSDAAFLQPGTQQAAAGFVIYGPQTSLAFSTGSGTHSATLDVGAGCYRMTRIAIRVPEGSREFAINASNRRHWLPPVQAYIDDLLEGADGPRGENFNMRWIASLVADAYRIFVRGGVFLYPADARESYERGRLRHLYEANPIAFLIEQAGGAATDGINRILDAQPGAIHERIPFVFGSLDKVERIRLYHVEHHVGDGQSPNLGRRLRA